MRPRQFRPTTEDIITPHTVMPAGQIGYDSIKKAIKVGDGDSSWSTLKHLVLEPVSDNRARVQKNGQWVTAVPSGKLNTIVLSPEYGDVTSFAELQILLDSYNASNRTDGVVVLVDAGHYDITDTMVINYPFPVKITGGGESVTILHVTSALDGKPMFTVNSDAHFEHLSFDGSTYPTWSNSSNAAFINVETSDHYIVVWDFTMTDGARGICCKTNATIFVFNFVMENMTETGIGYNTLNAGGDVDVEIGNFINCATGVNLVAGTDVNVHLAHLIVDNELGQTGILYDGTNFTYNRFSIQSILFKGAGGKLGGFDLTLKRDSDIEIDVMMGCRSSTPIVAIRNLDNAGDTVLTTQNTHYLMNATIASENRTRFSTSIVNNSPRVTYLSTFVKQFRGTLTGTFVSSSSGTYEITVFKTNSIVSIVGQTTIRVITQTRDVEIPFAFNIHSEETFEDDYFDIRIRCTTASGVTAQIRNYDLYIIAIK